MFDDLRKDYLFQPHEVSFETFAFCNAACTFCPYPALERRGARMPDAMIDSLIEQMSVWEKPFYISPFKVNEPLLDPRMQSVCERIEREVPNANLRLFTNGHALTEANIEWMDALCNLPELWVSLNSCDSQEYGEMMKLSFSTVERRLNALHDRMTRRDFSHDVVLSRVMTDDERDSAFIEACHERWSFFRPVLIKRDGWLGYTEPTTSEVPQKPCSRWFELNITAEGKAVLCCMDGKGEFVLGDVVKTELDAIYNQPHLIRRRYSAMNRIGIEPCERCTY